MTRQNGRPRAGRGAVAGLLTGFLLLTACQQNRPVAAGVEEAETVTVAETTLPDNRMVYPWSVVPGGVDSAQAMGKAMESDPVVGAHYAGLRPEGFHPERLTEKKEGYVSYRIRDKIYWTRRMVTLAAGEQVLTDGATVVRGRCGNLFSPVPREPVAPLEAEPAEKAMDEPVRAAQLTASPEMRAETPVETEKFENPKGFHENAESVLPVPQPEDALPPVWVAGGGIPGPGGGVMGVGGTGGGGGGSTPGVPGAVTTETGGGSVTPPGIVPVTPSTAVTIPPPLVLAALTLPPSTPLIWEHPVFTPPDLVYPPVGSPQPPQIWVPPVGSPPVTYPPVTYPPGTDTPPTGTPPPTIPPTTPPSGPPPSGPPTDGPPPSGPPLGPPPSGPPPFEPPGSPPPDVAVPEPGAWVLAVLGIGAIAAGSIRRKS